MVQKHLWSDFFRSRPFQGLEDLKSKSCLEKANYIRLVNIGSFPFKVKKMSNLSSDQLGPWFFRIEVEDLILPNSEGDCKKSLKRLPW